MKNVEDTETFDDKNARFSKMYPDLDIDTRLGWLIAKRFFGPITEEEKIELWELMYGKESDE